ncbi:BQ5605_C001g00618 [Microbotryum silenes-dioicae]|uniref:BQ5605_C001g00618 protein n=1 Tax=Microbotryum silenes-dioicae TaxID=796604 RepID=A0A2X0M7Y9_9BASI|nr:BQ5605_C001g00618 [Microbotryum silenes-dioicae]
MSFILLLFCDQSFHVPRYICVYSTLALCNLRYPDRVVCAWDGRARRCRIPGCASPGYSTSDQLVGASLERIIFETHGFNSSSRGDGIHSDQLPTGPTDHWQTAPGSRLILGRHSAPLLPLATFLSDTPTIRAPSLHTVCTVGPGDLKAKEQLCSPFCSKPSTSLCERQLEVLKAYWWTRRGDRARVQLRPRTGRCVVNMPPFPLSTPDPNRSRLPATSASSQGSTSSPTSSAAPSDTSSSGGGGNQFISFLTKVGRGLGKASASGAEASATGSASTSPSTLPPASRSHFVAVRPGSDGLEGFGGRAVSTGSSSRGAGVKLSKSKMSAIDPIILDQELKREEAIAAAFVAGGGRGGRGGLITSTYGKTKPTVAATTTGYAPAQTTTSATKVQSARKTSLRSPTSRSSSILVGSPVSPATPQRLSIDIASSPPYETLPPTIEDEGPMMRPSQILSELSDIAQHTSDPSRLIRLMQKLAKSVATYPFPPPALAAAPLSQALSSHPTSPAAEADDTTPPHRRRAAPTPTPVQIYLSQSRWLSPHSPPALREAVLALLVASIEASQSATGGMKETDKAIYWDETRRWAEEGKVQADDGLGGRRWMLPDTERELLVTVLSIMTKRGRDLSDVPGLVALLCHFVTESLPTPRPPSPLFDLTLQTPLVRKSASMPPSKHASALALLTALHRFSAPYVYANSTRLALKAMLEVARLQDEDDIGGVQAMDEHGNATWSLSDDSKDGSMLGFLTALIRHGEVAGKRDAHFQAQIDDDFDPEGASLDSDELLHEIVAVVARIIGLEGHVRVVDLIDGDSTPPSTHDRATRPSELPPRAQRLMTELIRSPANQALKSLRSSLIAPPATLPRPLPPVLLLVGTLRSLRKALDDHSKEVETSVERRADSITKTPSWSDHRLPNLLSLGLPYLWNGMRRAMEWQSAPIDAEVLKLMDDRLEAMDRLARKIKDVRKAGAGGIASNLLTPSGMREGGLHQEGPEDEGEQGVGYEEWDMTIDLLMATKWHIDTWETTKLKSWTLEEEDISEDEESRDELAPASSSGHAWRQPEVLEVFAALLRRLIRAWRHEDGFSGPSERVLALLISLASHLPESYALHVLEQTEAHALCLPTRTEWLDRTQEILKAFYVSPSRGQGSVRVLYAGPAASVRRRTLQLVSSLHSQLHHQSEQRDALVSTIILPLLETSFEVETDAEVAEVMITLSNEVVRDSLGTEEVNSGGPLGPFDRLRLLLVRNAKGSVRPFDRYSTSAPTTPKARRTNLASLSRYHKDNSPSAMRSSPSISAPVATPSIAGSTTQEPADISHVAVMGLITMFHVCLETSTYESSEKGVQIFRDLLALLSPAAAPSSDALTDYAIPLRTRMLILAWLVRLRADASHRVQWVHDVDITSAATALYRAEQANGPAMDALNGAMEDGSRGRSGRGSAPPSERSASASRARRGNDDRSPSRMGRRGTQTPATPAGVVIATGPPLWAVPETLPFNFGSLSSSFGAEGLVSFDHHRMRYWTEEQDPGTGQFVAKEIVDPSAASDPEAKVVVLPVSEYLCVVNHLLAHDQEWELLSYLLCHLPEQLSNKHFAAGPRASLQIYTLLKHLCFGLRSIDRPWPNILPMGVKRAEAQAVTYQILTALIAYRSLFSRQQQHEMVETFMCGLSNPRDLAKPCIHALSIASFEMRPSVTKHLSEIVRNLQKIISSAELGVHILEFIAGIGQQPSVYSNFTDVDFQTVFGIALKYIQAHNERLLDAPLTAEDEEGIEYAFSQYVFLLAYYCIAAWFLALRLSERPKFVPFLTRRLVQANEGKPEVDEATEVCFDMIARYTYTNADPRVRASSFDDLLTGETQPALGVGPTLPSKSWIIGTATITISNVKMAGWVEVTIRRASGIVKMMWELQNITGVKSSSDAELVSMYMRHRENAGISGAETIEASAASFQGPTGIAPAAPKLDSAVVEAVNLAHAASLPPTLESGLLTVGPEFFALQLSPFPELAPNTTPVLMPDDPAYGRALRMLDRVPVVDLHKIGVLYIGPGQFTEAEILANTHGSKPYIEFISELGQLWRLKDHPQYCGGLDREQDFDGKWMYVWDDDIAQMFFHVATLMPTDFERHPRSERKKSHIGNDFVKVIFNESGGEFAFDTLPSEFNFVNIVIQPHTPAGNPWLAPGMTSNAQFFKVTMQCRAGMPEIGPLGSFKMVAGTSLPHVVRQLALHSNIFAQIYLATVGFEGGHGKTQRIGYVSNWRQRLQQIKQLKKRINDQRGTAPPSTQGQRLNVEAAELARLFTSWL